MRRFLTTDADGEALAGYNVYRSDSANGDYTLLNALPLTAIQYTDTTAPGGTKFYRVSSVDSDGLESARSPALMSPTSSQMLSGDLNDDWSVDLTDALIALKVLMGANTAGLLRADYKASSADVNGNAEVGLQELLYILEKIGGLSNTWGQA